MPLNIDWQQILLHWMNLAILIGGLYFLLYRPVKQFMKQREEHYRALEREAQEKLQEAQQIQAQYQEKLDRAEEEARQIRIRAQQSAQESTDSQLAQAQAEARQIITRAQTEAENSRERVRRESQRELRELATAAVRKLVFRPEADPFDQFLDLTEGGEAHEG